MYISYTYRVVKYQSHIIDLSDTRYIIVKYRIDIVHLSDSADIHVRSIPNRLNRLIAIIY